MSRFPAKSASIGNFGFLRAAAVVPKLSLGDPAANAQAILRSAREATKNFAGLVVFPELSLTGYTLGDLFRQEVIQRGALESLGAIMRGSKSIAAVLVVGLPFGFGGKLFNIAAVVFKGNILGLIPKTYIPGYQEFYEERWFASARDLTSREVKLFGRHVPIGTDILFRSSNDKNFVLGVEICEDLWAPIPPSSFHVLAGATVIANLSASNELTGKVNYRKTLVSQQSARGICGYVYSSSGVYESTTDIVYAGHALIGENGYILEESKRFERQNQIIYADLDLEHIAFDRERTTSFGESVHEAKIGSYRLIDLGLESRMAKTIKRHIDPYPFVPQSPEERDRRVEEIFSIQAAGLAKRMEHVRSKRLIIGLSGGLDSTLALLVAVKACRLLGTPTKNISAFTMPGFATSARTKSNTRKLARAFSIRLGEIDIRQGAEQQLRDIGHAKSRQDTVFENVQARYRTMILMNKANQLGGIVVGTGDLSEIALGWNTYSGDHLSHYNVNAGVPKTLVRYLIEWVSEQKEFAGARETVNDILHTPISPELVRKSEDTIMQETERIIGPYELHDFFLYHFLRWGSQPRKIFFLALRAFGKKYTMNEIRRWLKVFLERFFKNQWKRSVMPDGPKVGSVALSPRGDWRAPSDLDAKVWLEDLN